MRTRDITKLALNPHFEIYRINESGEGIFSLKKMDTKETPSWNIVSQKQSLEDILNVYNKIKNRDKYSLLCSHPFTSFDLIELSKHNYKIIKLNYEDALQAYSFDYKTIKWVLVKHFENIFELNIFCNCSIKDPKTILID